MNPHPPQPASDESVAVDESELVARLRAGDDAAFEELVRDYAGRMLAATRRILRSEDDAQDSVQEAFLSAFKALDRFQGDSRLGTWLHRIAINAALMKLRSQKRRREVDVDGLLPRFREPDGHHEIAPKSWSPPADDPLEREETRAVVRAHIDQLPDNYRLALVLRDIEELSTEEVAQHLGVTVNAAKIRVHRARQALRTLLEPRFGAASQ